MIRIFLRFVAWGLAPIALYLVLALVGAFVPAIGRGDVASVGGEREIILAAGVIHYDILLPLDDETRAVFSFLDNTRVPLDEAAWLAVGWGSEAFYTSAGQYSDVTWAALGKALTWDRSAMRFEVYDDLPIHPDLKRMSMSEAQLDVLRESIRGDLGDTPVELEAEGLSETDAFFAAEGAFNMVRTCNVWIGQKLSDAGLSFGIWTPTPYAVRLSLWWNGVLGS